MFHTSTAKQVSHSITNELQRSIAVLFSIYLFLLVAVSGGGGYDFL